ncbi:YgaP family membrane protein [Halioxenophilus aromaticivorans]|uniref:Inner membrane protein YgaP-like transmembrane domain-containing protein n=1 Tax=Halioxenophilus aromaticivorans TaxID=1306992 RepID=A0AAV3U2T0_9ALTE
MNNVGEQDKKVRFTFGVVALLIGLFIAGAIWLKVVLFVVAGAAIGTALLNFCPAYKLLGINTCAIKSKD